jgi:hypothetical protein
MSLPSSQNPEEPRRPLDTLFSIFSSVLIGLFLSKLLHPEQESSSPAHPQDTTRNASNIGQNVSSPVHVVIDASPPTPTPDETRKAREEDKDRRDKKRYRVEVATACFLFVYTVITLFMWSATKKSADAAKQSAIAAHEASDTSRDALVDVQRAFVFSVSDYGQENDYWRLTVRWRNGGTTPTKNMIAHISYQRCSQSVAD